MFYRTLAALLALTGIFMFIHAQIVLAPNSTEQILLPPFIMWNIYFCFIISGLISGYEIFGKHHSKNQNPHRPVKKPRPVGSPQLYDQNKTKQH